MVNKLFQTYYSRQFNCSKSHFSHSTLETRDILPFSPSSTSSYKKCHISCRQFFKWIFFRSSFLSFFPLSLFFAIFSFLLLVLPSQTLGDKTTSYSRPLPVLWSKPKNNSWRFWKLMKARAQFVTCYVSKKWLNSTEKNAIWSFQKHRETDTFKLPISIKMKFNWYWETENQWINNKAMQNA